MIKSSQKIYFFSQNIKFFSPAILSTSNKSIFAALKTDDIAHKTKPKEDELLEINHDYHHLSFGSYDVKKGCHN